MERGVNITSCFTSIPLSFTGHKGLDRRYVILFDLQRIGLHESSSEQKKDLGEFHLIAHIFSQ